MIQSVLDNDLYKFTMQQAVHRLYPRAEARYEFINRGRTPFPDDFARALRDGIEQMADLRLSEDQKQFLQTRCLYLTPVYLDFLGSYRYDPGEVTVKGRDGDLSVTIQGPWYRTILWEVPVMAVISELFFRMTGGSTLSSRDLDARDQRKATAFSEQGVRFADFGTRRRYSAQNHERVIQNLLRQPGSGLIGTSNVHLAHAFDIQPIGTLAHEWFMFHAVLCGYPMANTAAMDAWIRVFQGDLGIALTDTYTTDVFLSGFNTFYAKLFDGVRQDSGDPLAFIETMIRHYERLGIDPSIKTLVFSDGLDVGRAIQIHQVCRGRVRDAYGIGTSLTNDVGVTPLNMVIKLTACRVSSDKPWRRTVKLSDDRGKHTGDPQEIRHCLRVLEL